MELSTDDARGLIKNHNESQPNTADGRARRLGFLQEKNIKCLIWWLRDKRRLQLIPTVAQWTVIEMSSAHEAMEIAEKAEDASTDKVDIPTMGEDETGIGY